MFVIFCCTFLLVSHYLCIVSVQTGFNGRNIQSIPFGSGQASGRASAFSPSNNVTVIQPVQVAPVGSKAGDYVTILSITYVITITYVCDIQLRVYVCVALVLNCVFKQLSMVKAFSQSRSAPDRLPAERQHFYQATM